MRGGCGGDDVGLGVVMPIRIQRKRTKGWKLPEGAVYVGRPTKWGNPVKVCRLLCAENAKEVFALLVWPSEDAEDGLDNRAKFYLRAARSNWTPVTFEEIQEELRGKDLACWCPLVDKDGNAVPCHADVLLEIANK